MTQKDNYKKKLKILYILPSLDAKAPIFLAKTLAEYMIQNGDKVEVAYFDNKKETKFPCRTYQINMSMPISFDRYDIIHSHMRRPDKYVAKFKKNIHHAKTISTIHCDIGDDLKWTYGNLISFIYTPIWIGYLKKFDCTVQINDYLLKKYQADLRQSVLIYNGVDVDNTITDDHRRIIKRLKKYKSNGLITVVTYSSIIKRKGLEQIVKAVKDDISLSYICIGDGNEKKKLQEAVKKMNIANRVSFFNSIKSPYNILPYADIYAVPSLSEGFSLAALEAGTIGTSMVCSDIPAFRGPFSEEEVTFFQLNNIESLIGAIHKAFNEKQKKEQKLKHKIVTKYSVNIMQQHYRQLYNKLATEKGSF